MNFATSSARHVRSMYHQSSSTLVNGWVTFFFLFAVGYALFPRAPSLCLRTMSPCMTLYFDQPSPNMRL